MGTPPLWTDRWMDGRTDACQNITFPRTTYAGGKECNEIIMASLFYSAITQIPWGMGRESRHDIVLCRVKLGMF